MMAATHPPDGDQACAALLRRIRAHAADGLLACGSETLSGIATRQLKRAKPQLRSDAAQAMMKGTTAMLEVVEAWSDDLVVAISNEMSRREDALQQLVQSCVEYSAGEVSVFVQAASAATAAERKEALNDLAQSLTGKAMKEQQTMTHALNTKLESVNHQLKVQKEAFTQRTQELEAQNKELEARLVVSEEKLVASARREEAAKLAGQEHVKASTMGRDALQTRIRRLERELKAEKVRVQRTFSHPFPPTQLISPRGEQELRVSLQTRSAAAKALWGKASDGVGSGALWTRLANAAAELEQPIVEDVELEEPVQPETETEPAVDTVAGDTPIKPTTRAQSEEAATAASTPQPTAVSSKTASGTVLVSPIFESPGAPGHGSLTPELDKHGTGANGAANADAPRLPASASTRSGNQRRGSLGSGLERLTASRPRSALALRRERSLVNLSTMDRVHQSAVAVAACSPNPRLQRRASTSTIQNGDGFMADTAASGARALQKGQPKGRQQGRTRVALGVRVQGLATDVMPPQFDRGGFPIP